VIVVDTNVISEAMKPPLVRAAEVMKWLEGQSIENLHTTAVSLAEIRAGIAILPEGKRRSGKQGAAEELFVALFQGRVLPFDEPAAYAYAEIVTQRRKAGRTLEALDIQIAAIAKSNNMAVATRNVADFEGSGVAVISPWSA
jgi:toxin FitB